MMSFYRAIPLDQRRAKKARTGERLPIAASLMIWALLIGASWFGIIGLVSLFV